MSEDISPRERRVAEWWFQDVLAHKGRLPSGKSALIYMKTLMDLAAADGIFHEEERKWVLGFASTCGLHDDLIRQLENHQPGTNEDANHILNDADAAHVKAARLGMIYYAFRASSADGELHQKEADAIAAMGKRLGINDAKIAELRVLSDEEEQLRRKRASILFPQGLDDPINKFEKKFS